MPAKDQWIVVGGGVSGMAAAFFLRQHGIDSEIIEKDGAIGGRMGSLQLGDRWVDFGGKNLGKRYKLFREFVATLGQHEFEYFGLNSSQVRNGKIITFEGTRRLRTLVEIGRDASLRDAVRFARLLWQVRSNEENGYLGSEFFGSVGRQHDMSPASTYFSGDFCRRIIRPMSVRMNGAEPDEIYVGNLGSNLRMILDSFDQLRNGLAPLLDDFMSSYKVRLNTAVEQLLFRNGRVNGVRIRQEGGASEDLIARGVILATPAWISAELVAFLDFELARQLRRVSYYPVTLVLAEYNRPIFSPDVRALVFEEKDPVSNAGAYGIHDLHLVRYTFSGRSARRHMGDPNKTEELLDLGEMALNRYIPVKKSERKRFRARHFNLGLCAYTPFHSDFLSDLKSRIEGISGMHLTGDYIQGASLEACFRTAKSCVEELVRRDCSQQEEFAEAVT
jgi:oxygen-dependent protoporphyrinogen oxidase